MTRLTRFFRILLIAAVGMLSSCIDSTEEVWLEKSGSGRARVIITVPNAVFTLRGGESGISRLIDRILPPESSVSRLEKSFHKGTKETTIEVSFHFASALRLKENLDTMSQQTGIPSAIHSIAGISTIERRGLGITARRSMDFGKAIPGSAFMAPQVEGRQLTTIIHLPLRPSAHNATRTTDAGHTLIWEKSLAAAMQSPYEQRVEFRLPVMLLTGIALGLLVLITLLIRTVKRRKHRRATALQHA